MNRIKFLYSIPTLYRICKLLKNNLEDCISVLDAGCGQESILHQLGMKDKVVTGIDIWKEYADKHYGDIRYCEYITSDIVELTRPEKFYDAVILIDVIEHIDKRLVLDTKLLEKIESWTKKKIIIITPYGFIDNDGMSNPYMIHKSGWMPYELQFYGYKTYVTWRVRRKKYLKITGLEFVKTIVAVKDCK